MTNDEELLRISPQIARVRAALRRVGWRLSESAPILRDARVQQLRPRVTVVEANLRAAGLADSDFGAALSFLLGEDLEGWVGPPEFSDSVDDLWDFRRLLEVQFREVPDAHEVAEPPPEEGSGGPAAIMDEMEPPVGVSDGAPPSRRAFEEADRAITERYLLTGSTGANGKGWPLSASPWDVLTNRFASEAGAPKSAANAPELQSEIDEAATDVVLALGGDRSDDGSSGDSEESSPMEDDDRRSRWVVDRLRNTDRHVPFFSHTDTPLGLFWAILVIFDVESFEEGLTTEFSSEVRDDSWDNTPAIMDEMEPPVGVSDGAPPSRGAFERADREIAERDIESNRDATPAGEPADHAVRRGLQSAQAAGAEPSALPPELEEEARDLLDAAMGGIGDPPEPTPVVPSRGKQVDPEEIADLLDRPVDGDSPAVDGAQHWTGGYIEPEVPGAPAFVNEGIRQRNEALTAGDDRQGSSDRDRGGVRGLLRPQRSRLIVGALVAAVVALLVFGSFFGGSDNEIGGSIPVNEVDRSGASATVGGGAAAPTTAPAVSSTAAEPQAGAGDETPASSTEVPGTPGRAEVGGTPSSSPAAGSSLPEGSAVISRTVSSTITVAHAPQDATGAPRAASDTVCDVSAFLEDLTSSYQSAMTISCSGDAVGRLGLLTIVAGSDGTQVYPVDGTSEGPQALSLNGSEVVDTGGEANVSCIGRCCSAHLIRSAP